MIIDLDELLGEETVILPQRENNLSELVDGQFISNEFGSYFLVEHTTDLCTKYGDFEVESPRINHIFLKQIGAKGTDIKPDKIIFIDTETTGLAGGTGTFAFMIGVGFVRENSFITKQYFMSDFGDEPAMLHDLEKELDNFEVMVSFNGKSFDIPLIKNRFTMQNFEDPIGDKLHIDLLHLSRRLWKNELESCSLGSLEYFILRFDRDLSSDILGSEIPDTYYNYLDTGDSSEIKNIFYHNEMDVLSMDILLNLLTDMFSLRFPSPQIKFSDYAVGKIYADNHELDIAKKYYEFFRQTATERLLFELSYLYKKTGEIDKAKSIWEIEAGNNKIYALIELAMQAEHAQRNFEVAKKFTEKAITLAELDILKTDKLLELYHRLTRLNNKIQNN